MRHWGPAIDPVPIVIATILALEEFWFVDLGTIFGRRRFSASSRSRAHVSATPGR